MHKGTFRYQAPSRFALRGARRRLADNPGLM